MRKNFLFVFGTAWAILCFFIFDRFLKALFLFQPTKSLGFLIFRFSLYRNEKIFFGLLSFNFLAIVFAAIFVFYLVYWLIYFWHRGRFFSFFAGFLILLGALSNLLDRFRYGFVIDYISWPLNFFNLADLMILAGAILFLIGLLKNK